MLISIYLLQQYSAFVFDVSECIPTSYSINFFLQWQAIQTLLVTRIILEVMVM